MKIGLYFGTYNPIHIGHMIIANHIAEFSDLDQIWIVVTPHNPVKKKDTLLNDYHRLHMVFLATENFTKIIPSDIEFKLPQPNYTINTLVYLDEKFPQHTFSLIMGRDNLNTLYKWKNYDVILKHYNIYIYPRIFNETVKLEFENYPNILQIDAPAIEISSSFIRSCIKQGKNVQPLLIPKVWEYIEHNLFYKK